MRVEILHRIFGAEMNHQKICYIFVGTQLELEPLRIKGCNKANYIYIYVCIAYALYNYDKLTSSNACLSSFSEGFFIVILFLLSNIHRQSCSSLLTTVMKCACTLFLINFLVVNRKKYEVA